MSLVSCSKYQGYITVLGAFLMMLALGNLYTYGNVSVYLFSSIHGHDPTVEIKNSAWVYSALISSQSVNLVSSFYLTHWLGHKWTGVIGSTIYSLGIFLTAFTCHSFVWTIVTYGIMTGAGNGITYNVAMVSGMKWFPHRKGLVNGIIMAGFGLGAFVFNPVITAIVNPHNIAVPEGQDYFDLKDLGHLKSCFMALGSICYVLMMSGLLMMQDPPKVSDSLQEPLLQSSDAVPKPEEVTVPPAPTKVPITSSHAMEGLPWRRIFFTKQFYLLWFSVGCFSLAVTVTSSFWKNVGEARVTKDDMFLSLVGSFSSITNCLGRVFWGAMNDKIGFRYTAALIIAINAVADAILYSMRSKALYFIMICLIYSCIGGYFCQLPTEAVTSFGQKNFQIIYGLMLWIQILTTNIGSLLASTLYKVIGLSGLLLILASILGVSSIVTLFFYRSYDWRTKLWELENPAAPPVPQPVPIPTEA